MARASASPDVIVAPSWQFESKRRSVAAGLDGNSTHDMAEKESIMDALVMDRPSRPSAGRTGSALGGSGRARPLGRWQLLLLGGDDRRLLPPVLRRPAGQSEERPLSREPGRGRGGRLSPLQAVQARPAGDPKHAYAARVAEACRLIEEAEETPSSGRAGSGRRPQHLPLPPRLQGRHGADAPGLRRCAPERRGSATSSRGATP